MSRLWHPSASRSTPPASPRAVRLFGARACTPPRCGGGSLVAGLLVAALLGPTRALAEEAPVSLTASDGTGLALVGYSARAVIEDPLAFTELRLTFQNPQPRTIEGQFRITLPQGATVSRFAMRLGERWQEGEVVEKQAARRAYEDFLHRRQDPALLEQAAGNEFSARVFPIPGGGQKELVVSWSHELPSADAPYVLPLKGLPQVKALSLQAFSGGVSVAALEKTGYVPDRDFVVKVDRAGRVGVRAGDLVVARVKAVATSSPEPIPSLLILVDTSASRALGFPAQLSLLQRVVERLAAVNAALPLTVAAFDQTVQVIHEGPASAYGAAAQKALRDRRALGASDLAAALRWAAERGKNSPAARVFLVTDGVFTAGAVGGDELSALAARLKDVGVQRLDAVAMGGIRDEAALRRLVSARLPKAGALLDGDAGADVVVRRLGEATVQRVPVTAEGASVVWPTVLEGVQAGDEAVVVLERVGNAPKLKVGDVTVDLSRGLTGLERPLVQRAWAQAQIKALVHRLELGADGEQQKQTVRAQIVGMSVKHRVLSPYTALLVLETEADYERFRIDRRALADVLTVEGGRLAVQKRGPETVAKQTPVPLSAPAKGDSLQRAKKDAPSARGVPEQEPLQSVEEAKAANADKVGDAESSLAGPRGGEAQGVGGLGVRGTGSGGGGSGVPERRAAGATMRRAAAASPSPADSAPQEVQRSLAAGAPPPAPPASPAPAGSMPRPEPTSRPREGGDATRNFVDFHAPGGQPAREAVVDPRETEQDEARGTRIPWEGTFKEVMVALGGGQRQRALERARAWREESPGDVLALVALGEALEATGDVETAGRAYGSIVDLFPARADLRRYAGVRLERLKGGAGLALAADVFAKAAEQRADHPQSHRLLAFALLRLGKHAEAFAAIERALEQRYPDGRFRGVLEILREDAGLVAAAWMKAQPGAAADVRARLARVGGVVEDAPSLRFVLNWETDANDVDFHIHDAKGGHAYYGSPQLASGGRLYADVTTGYGPECFTIRGPRGGRAYPYKLRAHYYSRGPMGYGMGKLQIVEHDGRGGLSFEDRPFVVMVDSAFVDLGTVAR